MIPVILQLVKLIARNIEDTVRYQDTEEMLIDASWPGLRR